YKPRAHVAEPSCYSVISDDGKGSDASLVEVVAQLFVYRTRGFQLCCGASWSPFGVIPLEPIVAEALISVDVQKGQWVSRQNGCHSRNRRIAEDALSHALVPDCWQIINKAHH